nr:cytochrome c oxidase subunit III [Vignadula atrata]
MHRIPYSRYYVPGLSPWPFVVGLCCNSLCVSLVLWCHRMDCFLLFSMTFLLILVTVIFWWRDLLREGDMGFHTRFVVKSFRDGVGFFIFSEIMFFMSFFWALFHSCLSPSSSVGCEWPPIGIRVPNPFSTALFNSCLLISSGVFCTYAHKSIIVKDYDYECFIGLSMTILCGIVFIFIQLREYYWNSFSIADSIYGSVFYMLTGFHGAHVIVGTTWLLVSFLRMLYGHFSKKRHFGLEACLWYWHFVDIVWIMVWFFVYFWFSSS